MGMGRKFHGDTRCAFQDPANPKACQGRVSQRTKTREFKSAARLDEVVRGAVGLSYRAAFQAQHAHRVSLPGRARARIDLGGDRIECVCKHCWKRVCDATRAHAAHLEATAQALLEARVRCDAGDLSYP